MALGIIPFSLEMFLKKKPLIKTYQIMMRCQVTLPTLRLVPLLSDDNLRLILNWCPSVIAYDFLV